MVNRPEPPGKKPPLPGLVIHRFFFNGPGQPTPVANVLFHTKWSDSINHAVGDLQVLATTMRSAFQSYVWVNQAQTWTLQYSQSQSLGGDGNEFVTTGAPAPGGAVSGMPPQCAVCLSWKSTATWRGGRPRTYLPAVPQTAVVPGGGSALETAYATTLANNALEFMQTVNAITSTGANPIMGFPSYYTNYTWRPVPLFFPFTNVVVHQRLDSQRRRSGKERYFALS
jgi:hypothetical protein